MKKLLAFLFLFPIALLTTNSEVIIALGFGRPASGRLHSGRGG